VERVSGVRRLRFKGGGWGWGALGGKVIFDTGFGFKK